MLKLSSQNKKRKISNCIFLFTLKIVLLSFPFLGMKIISLPLFFLYFFFFIVVCDRRFPFIFSPCAEMKRKIPTNRNTLSHWCEKIKQSKKEEKENDIWLRLCILKTMEWEENWSKENKGGFSNEGSLNK